MNEIVETSTLTGMERGEHKELEDNKIPKLGKQVLSTVTVSENVSFDNSGKKKMKNEESGSQSFPHV